MRLHVEYAHSIDPESWRRRHADGLVPDALPYGLDRLEHQGLDLVVRAKPGAPLAFADSVSRRLSGGFGLVDGLRDRSRRSCDIALCWDERSGVPAALRSRLPGEPATALGVIWLTEPGEGSRRARALARAALGSAQLVWTLSSAQLEVLETEWRVDPSRLRMLLMGIDTDFWYDEGSGPDPDLVLGAGNDRHRDHALLVDALERVRRRRPGTRLELVTHHPVAVPPELGLKHESRSHPEMRSLYSRASVVALALKWNLHVSGMSVLLETMACGRPLVATETPGIRDYVVDGETGLLVPPGDPDAFADAVGSLLDDPDTAQRLGANARRRAVAELSTEHQGERLAGLLRETA